MLNEAIKAINDSHKTLWILCGLPYSGKTYLSREVLKNTSAVYVSIDEIFKKAGFDWDSNNLPNEKQWEEI
ncbi:MAG: AAA family ATPase, partial [Patescibacteria group bacterium]|nr:AAA family ATPase [Patescibacteria group bacterium]